MNSVISLPRIEANLLYLSETDFEEFILSLLRLKDDVGLKQIGFIAEDEVCSKWEDSKGKNISDVRDILTKYVQGPLDKLLMLCSLLIQYNNTSPLDTIISNFYGIYQMGGKSELGFDSEEEHLSSSVIWKEVILRIYVLGALTVLAERFEAVPILITKPWPKEYPAEILSTRLWSRHAAEILINERRFQAPSLCVAADEITKKCDWIFRKFRRNEDLFYNSVCQFDFLQCIYAFCKNRSTRDVFPSFGIFNNSRTEPIILDLVLGGKSREYIPNLSDKELAIVIRDLDVLAGGRFPSYNGWTFNYWRNNKIVEFLEKNLTSISKPNK